VRNLLRFFVVLNLICVAANLYCYFFRSHLLFSLAVASFNLVVAVCVFFAQKEIA